MNNLWIIVIEHSEVPGAHLMLMHQDTEPTDEEICGEMMRCGHDRDGLTCISVTHCFDLAHWLKQYDNRRALTAWIAAGGMET